MTTVIENSTFVTVYDSGSEEIQTIVSTQTPDTSLVQLRLVNGTTVLENDLYPAEAIAIAHALTLAAERADQGGAGSGVDERMPRPLPHRGLLVGPTSSASSACPKPVSRPPTPPTALRHSTRTAT